MNLKHLNDKTLLQETLRLVRSERRITTEILHHLKEVERRRLFSDLGHKSMMDYAVKELKYSHSAAKRRIDASRLIKKIPGIEKKISEGYLTLSNINQADSFFKKENIHEPAKQKEILEKLENKTSREAEKTLFELAPSTPLPKESIRPVSQNHTQLKINITEKTYQKLQEARSILGCHSINDEFLSLLSEHAIKDVKFKKFKVRETIQDPNSRYLTNQTKREVFEKSNGICENCGSVFLLQYDHIKAFSQGGKSIPENLRLLCFHCNQRSWFKTCNPDLS